MGNDQTQKIPHTISSPSSNNVRAKDFCEINESTVYMLLFKFSLVTTWLHTQALLNRGDLEEKGRVTHEVKVIRVDECYGGVRRIERESRMLYLEI